MKRRSTTSGWRDTDLAQFCAGTLLLAACSAQKDTSGGSTEQRPGPLYALSHSLLNEDTATSYVTVVDSLAPGPRVELDHSLEFGGGARAYGPEGADVVYVTSDEAGTLTEVRFAPDGSPQLGRVVSFANLGISSTTGGNVHHFISDTKAYFVSQDTLEIVVWNPATMEVVQTLPLDLSATLTSADGSFYFYPRAILVGDQLVLVANQSDSDDVDGPTVVSVVDTVADQVVSTTVEPRCHGMLESGLDARGDRYFASSDYSAAIHFMSPDQAPGPCLLRMLAGEVSFDPDWSRSFTTELGTRLWTGVTSGANAEIYVQSIAEDTPAVSDATDPYDLTLATPWRWYTLPDADAAPVAIEADFLTSPPLFPAIPVGSAAYVSLWDNADTTLVDLTSADTPQQALVVPGFVYNIVEIR